MCPVLEHPPFRLLAGVDVLFNLAQSITIAAQPMPKVCHDVGLQRIPAQRQSGADEDAAGLTRLRLGPLS